MSKRSIFILFTFSFIALFVLSACAMQMPMQAPPTLEAPADTPNEEKEPAATQIPDDTVSLPVEALRNATYTFEIYDEPIALTDGHWEGEPYVEGAASRPMVDYMEDSTMFGDLDSDGLEDAVVFLVESGGGSGSFVYVAAQLNRDGKPVDAGAVLIEDRIQIKSAAIDGGQVLVEAIVPGPGDGACCPSHKANKVFVMQDGTLVDVAAEGEELVKISSDDLDGTTWTLMQLAEDQPVLEDTEITIQFDDGDISGSAGCNKYTSAYSLDEDSPFLITLDPVIATRMACPDPIMEQETTYLSTLETVSIWGYRFGDLVLRYSAEDGTPALLIFTPADAEAMADDGQGALDGATLPPADIANDEGGPAVITGEFDYTSYVVPRYLNQSVIGLLDASSVIEIDYREFVSPERQILGIVTSPVSPAPLTYQVRLPIVPLGNSIDVDNDGQQGTGLQVYSAVIGPNYYGDITLDPIEQGWFQSYLIDPQDGTVREGYFLLYASDDAQSFPAAAGDDGVYFTADDPIVGLPAGYTVVQLGQDGTVTFDRSREGSMNILEAASTASPDFSDQGILESYNSLIDLLKTRYSYTELRGLDWEVIRKTYLPPVEAADEAEDLTAYYGALTQLAQSIRDAHVQVSGSAYSGAYIQQLRYSVAASLGAQLVELDDGRFIITFLDPAGPAAEEGWQFGSEIISVDGAPTAEYVESLPIFGSVGTQETARLSRLGNALRYPVDSTTTIEYRLPGESDVRSATLTPVVDVASAPPSTSEAQEISFSALDGGVGYIRWSAFSNLRYKVSVFERALESFNTAPGIILDLRGNGGGNIGLYFTLASYFFTAEEPATLGWLDEYRYDDAVGDLVKQFRQDLALSSPRPEIAYTGPVVALVDEHSASAGEYFPQFLQAMGRAVIVGEHTTEGAGGPIQRAAMPGGITFQYTAGRTYFAGTDELNLEAKGITLDVEVPATEENERAKLDGIDVVLNAGLETVAEEGIRLFSERLPGTSWQMFESVGLTGSGVSITEDPTAYTITYGEEGQLTIQADCNRANAEYTIGSGGAISITVGPTTLAACPDGSLSEPFLAAFSAVNSIEIATEGLGLAGIKEDGLPVALLFAAADSATEEESAAEMGETPLAGALPADLVAQLDAWLESQVYTEDGNPANASPGLVLLVETTEGRYLKAAGVASLEDGTPMQVDDRFEIGSNSKSFTIVLLMQLQEQGVLSLDDPLSTWLPDWAARIPNGEEMTLRQLAQHTSGIWDYGDPIIGEAANNPARLEQGYTPEELMQYAIDNGTPDFAPGEEGMWKYSNTGYILLGMVIEKAAGKPLGELYQERIFDPLGLESAVFIQGVPEPHEIVDGYYWTEDGHELNTTKWNVSQGWAAGGIAMTAEDLLTYARALSAGDLFQDPDSLTEMLTFDPNGMGGGFPYGLGLMDFSLSPGAEGSWGHEGQTTGFQTLWYTNPETGVTVVGLSNSASYSAFVFLKVASFLASESPEDPAAAQSEGDVAEAGIIEATFVCPDGTSIDAAFDNAAGTVTITLPDQVLTLPQVEAASGARYSNDTTTFWNKGDEAMVEVNGEAVYNDCVAQS